MMRWARPVAGHLHVSFLDYFIRILINTCIPKYLFRSVWYFLYKWMCHCWGVLGNLPYLVVMRGVPQWGWDGINYITKFLYCAWFVVIKCILRNSWGDDMQFVASCGIWFVRWFLCMQSQLIVLIYSNIPLVIRGWRYIVELRVGYGYILVSYWLPSNTPMGWRRLCKLNIIK